MRLTTRSGQAADLGYSANVHPGETLADVRRAIGIAAAVREELGAPGLSFGLWLSRSALDEVQRRGAAELEDALAAAGLYTVTMNGFPFGNFHAEVVKHAVYRPDWGDADRARYTVELAEVLAALLPPGAAGTISTLPLAHRARGAAGFGARAAAALSRLSGDLAELEARTGRSMRLCLEPEPGCLLETTRDAIELLAERMPEVAARDRLSAEARRHLGLCFDACHQAIVFEEASASLEALAAAGVAVGKVQLSCGLEGRREALLRFDEPRFLHQARARLCDGSLAAADDLPEAASALPADRPWRVHFHVPIHRELVGEVTTTRAFLEETLGWLGARDQPPPHLEVETYTWSVLPAADRPRGDRELARGIADELSFARDHL